MRGLRLLKSTDYWLGVPLCTVLGWGLRLRDQEAASAEPRRILVVKLAAVGDTVVVQPALRALRQRYPDAHLTWVASPINFSAAETVGGVDELRRFEPRNLPALGGFVSRLRDEQYELAVDFDQWSRMTALLVALSGARIRVGFDTRGQGRGLVYNRPFVPPSNTHELEHFLALARLAGATSNDRSIRLELPAEARARAAERLGVKRRKRVALHPGCGRAGAARQWPAERFAAVGDFAANRLGAEVYITGGADEGHVTHEVVDRMRAPAAVLCDEFAFADFAALIEQMDVVVCGNTGAMHIAAAVGTPTIALHGPTNPQRWGPVGDGHVVLQSPLPCSPCLDLGFEYGCASAPCMRTIGVAEVCQALGQRAQ